MANPSDKSPRNIEGIPDAESELYHLRSEFNKVILMFRQLTAKLDADTGITDTNYRSLITDTGGTTPAAKVIPVS